VGNLYFNYGLILSSSQFLIMLQVPQKIAFASNMVKSKNNVVTVLYESNIVLIIFCVSLEYS